MANDGEGIAKIMAQNRPTMGGRVGGYNAPLFLMGARVSEGAGQAALAPPRCAMSDLPTNGPLTREQGRASAHVRTRSRPV